MTEDQELQLIAMVKQQGEAIRLLLEAIAKLGAGQQFHTHLQVLVAREHMSLDKFKTLVEQAALLSVAMNTKAQMGTHGDIAAKKVVDDFLASIKAGGLDG